MSISVVHSIVAGLGNGAARFLSRRARANQHAQAIVHLEALPDYLRRDIGLPEDVSLAEAVERGLTPVTCDRETHRDLIFAPHAR